MNRILIILFAVMITAAGCRQVQQPKTWGDEPPEGFVEYFGDDNNARMDYAQIKAINRHVEALKQLNQRVGRLEAGNPVEIARRVRELEDVVEGMCDPNNTE